MHSHVQQQDVSCSGLSVGFTVPLVVFLHVLMLNQWKFRSKGSIVRFRTGRKDCALCRLVRCVLLLCSRSGVSCNERRRVFSISFTMCQKWRTSGQRRDLSWLILVSQCVGSHISISRVPQRGNKLRRYSPHILISSAPERYNKSSCAGLRWQAVSLAVVSCCCIVFFESWTR